SDRFSIHSKVWPTAFRTSPIRPDGKGFLAVIRDKVAGEHLAWLDWEGKETRIKAGADVLPDRPTPGHSMVGLPFFCDSRWEKDRAIVRWKDQQVEIDTKSFTAVRKKVRPPKDADDIIHNAFQFAKSKVELRFLGGEVFQERGHDFSGRLELVKPGAK